MITISYDTHPDQVGDLYPAADPEAPLVILLHGGFWRLPYGRDEFDAVARDLNDRGHAVWNLEYRRVGSVGGGWPGTGEDLLAAIDHLPKLAPFGVTPASGQVTLVGFSAGGHLALWGAGKRPLAVEAVIGLAPLSDLVATFMADLGRGAAGELLGAPLEMAPELYRAASPLARLPIRVPQFLIHGTADEAVPVEMSRMYVEAARRAGDPVELFEIAEGGHGDHLDPESESHQALVTCLTDRIGALPPLPTGEGVRG